MVIKQDFALFLAFLVIITLGVFALLPSLVKKPTHYTCVNNACVQVEGSGVDYCYSSDDCETTPQPSVFVRTVNPTVPAESEETPLADVTRECAEKFSLALSQGDVSKCSVYGCPLASYYCEIATVDFDCLSVVQGSGNQSKRDLCELNVAVKSGGMEQCGYLPSPLNEYCVALKEKDASKCVLVSNKFLQGICPSVIALLTGNKALCSEDYAECPALLGVLNE